MTTYTGTYRGSLTLKAGDDVEALTEVTVDVHVEEGATLNATALEALS